MAADPFAALVSRALGRDVSAVDIEHLESPREVGRAETDRVRWFGPDGKGSVLFRRFPPVASTEVALVPYLARHGGVAPNALATGVPPRHAAESRSWVLTEDPPAADLCATSDDVLRAAGAALRRLHEASKDDVTTIASLRLPELPPERIRDEARSWAEEVLPTEDVQRVGAFADRLDLLAFAEAESTLVHGALDCANGRVAEDSRIVFVGWSRAHLGAALLDVAHLSAVLGVRARAFLEGYGATPDLSMARILDRLFLVRWYAWEAREMLRPGPECALLARRALD